MDEQIEQLNEVRLSNLMSETDEELLAIALGKNDSKTIEQLYNKYKDVEIVVPEEPEEKEEPEEVIEEPEDIIPADDLKRKKSLDLYNKLRKTLRFALLKESILERHDCICFVCKTKFPTKENFKRNFSKKIYPLFVRCSFSIPTYIEKNNILTIDLIMDNKDIFNFNYHLPICTDCKPSRFIKK